jgi:hypothetical protein
MAPHQIVWRTNIQGVVATKKRRASPKALRQKKVAQSPAVIENPGAANAQAASAPLTDPSTAQKNGAAAMYPRKNAAPIGTAVDVKSAAVTEKAVAVSANARASLALHANLVKVVDASAVPAMKLALLAAKREIGGIGVVAVVVVVVPAVLTMGARGGEMLRIKDSMGRRRGGVRIVFFRKEKRIHSDD